MASFQELLCIDVLFHHHVGTSRFCGTCALTACNINYGLLASYESDCSTPEVSENWGLCPCAERSFPAICGTVFVPGMVRPSTSHLFSALLTDPDEGHIPRSTHSGPAMFRVGVLMDTS